MSNVGPEGRSFECIERADLERLVEIAKADLATFLATHSDWAAEYQDRLLAVALCQGAALHFLDGKTGVQDFDVYAFFARHPRRAWYAKRNKSADFGEPKFGTSLDQPHYVGRRVDLMGRSLDVPPDAEPAGAIRNWLRNRRTQSAAYLAGKAVVLLTPEERIGEVVWPEESRSPAP